MLCTLGVRGRVVGMRAKRQAGTSSLKSDLPSDDGEPMGVISRQKPGHLVTGFHQPFLVVRSSTLPQLGPFSRLLCLNGLPLATERSLLRLMEPSCFVHGITPWVMPSLVLGEPNPGKARTRSSGSSPYESCSSSEEQGLWVVRSGAWVPHGQGELNNKTKARCLLCFNQVYGWLQMAFETRALTQMI